MTIITVQRLILAVQLMTSIVTSQTFLNRQLSNRSIRLQLQYRILEETVPGTFVADLFDDMGLQEDLQKHFRRTNAGIYHHDNVENAESTKEFHPRGIVYFSDSDEDINSEHLDLFGYTLTDLPDSSSGNSNASDFFEIKGWILKSKVKLDREMICPDIETCHVSLDVIAADEQGNLLRHASIVIEVVDINDHEPTFQPGHISLKISESAEVGAGFGLPLAVDRDSPRFTVETYLLVSEDFTPFELHVGRHMSSSQVPSRGPPNLIKLLLREKLDREEVSEYRLKVIAYDAGDEFVGIPSKTGSLNLDVEITDVNDNFPLFQINSSEIEIMENHPLSEPVFRAVATDRDEGMNGEIMFRFDYETESKIGRIFSINENSGEIFLKSRLDRESHSRYFLVILASDMSGESDPSSLTSTASLTVNVLDINDNQPQIRIIPDDQILCKGYETRLVSKYETKTDPIAENSNQRRIKLFVYSNPTSNGSKCFSKDHPDRHSERKWMPLFRATATDADDERSGNGVVEMEMVSVSNYRGRNKFSISGEDSCLDENFFLDPSTGRVYVDESVLMIMIKEISNNDGDEDHGNISPLRYEVEDYEASKQKRKQLICQVVIRATDRGRPRLSSEVSVFVIISNRSAPGSSKKNLKTSHIHKTKLTESTNHADTQRNLSVWRTSNGHNITDGLFHSTSKLGEGQKSFRDENAYDYEDPWVHPTNNKDNLLYVLNSSPVEVKTASEHWLHRYLESRDLILVLSVVLLFITAAVVVAIVIVFNPQKIFTTRLSGSANVSKQLIT